MTETYYSFNVPYKLALIADSHDQPVPHLKESLEKNQPDVICIAGDIVYGHPPKNGLKMDESSNAMQLIRECVSVAWTCISFGNHEWLLNDHDIEIIRSSGAVVALRPKYSHRVKRILAYETLSETGWDVPNTTNEFIPNVYIDILSYNIC